MVPGTVDGSTTSTLRTVNARAVLGVLRADIAPHTVAELATATGLTRPTVDAALLELVRRGLAIEVGPPPGRRGAGRPGRRFRFRAEAGLAVGVDLQPDRIRTEIVDLAGNTVGRGYTEDLALGDPGVAVDTVRAELESLLSRAGLELENVGAVGISVPGVVDGDGTLWKSVVVPAWVDADLATMLGESFPRQIPILVDNTSNFAVLSEAEEHPSASMVFVLVDERVGAGITIDGRPVRGRRGAAGEVGVLDELRWDAASRNLLSHPEVTSVYAIQRFSSSNAAARRAMVQFATDVAIGTAALVLAYDPDLVIFGGIAATADEEFFGLLCSLLADRCLYRPNVARARFAEGAVTRGASLRALAEVEKLRYP